MLDFVLGALLVALAVRGWMRGFVRESVSLIVLVVGLFFAFRLSTPGGAVIESLAGTSTDASRLAAGIVIFVLISAAAAVISSFLHRGIRVLPGLPTINRAAGAGLGVLAGVVVATLLLSLVGVVPLPNAVASPIEESTLASRITDPVSPTQKVMGVISGDRVIEQVLKLQDAVGERRLVASQRSLLIPAAPEDELVVATKQAARSVELVERSRAAADVDGLEPSATLDQLALDYAMASYTTGRFSNVTAAGDTVDDRLDAAGLPVTTSAQVMVLATSAKSAHEGIMDDPQSAGVVVDEAFRRIGVAAVKGPLGLVIVQIYTG